MIVDLYAGPGGWSQALRSLDVPGEVGIEWDAAACATRAAAGFLTVRADIGQYPTAPFVGKVSGLIGSPPCPAFSAAGKREGSDHVSALIEAIHRAEWHARPSSDPLVWLTLDIGRWLDDLEPEWITLEQVPAVLPIWQAFAHHLDRRGYSVWTGVLNAADYGVPQTRRRAILIASRTRTVTAPPATHDRDPQPTLFGDALRPWVTMAEALGWTGEARVGFPRLDDRGDSADGYRERDWRDAQTEPAGALTEKARSWLVNTGRDWKAGGTREDEPAPTLAFGHDAARWTFERPATTIACDPRVWPPGHKINQGDRDRLGDEEAQERYGDRAGTEALRLEVVDALRLQSFPADYPVQGSRTKQFEQVGNAIPPGLARAILAVVTK